MMTETARKMATKGMKVDELVSDFLRCYGLGRVMSAPDAAKFMVEVWGLCFDWHDFSKALDRMEARGAASIVSSGGYTQYYIHGPRSKARGDTTQ